MQHDPNARTQIIEVPLPEELTEPLPADASPVTIAARTAAETALGVHGVHHLGNLLARAADTVRARFGRSAGTTGVQVDETDGELDVVVSIVVEYPEPVVRVADEVRRQVREAVAQLNFDVVSVDVRVLDVHGPFDDEPSALDRAVESGKDAVDRVRTAASEAAAHVEESAADAAERARDAASRAVDRAGDATDAAREAVADATDRVRDGAAEAADRARDGADRAREAASAAGDDATEAAGAALDAAVDERAAEALREDAESHGEARN
ncbi:Asp23/Gls24 family envelope stress response protein [Curtobacterium sp. NPDC098951]|uniref:Asp23/Gls24 family envelope stress response protein n=1 Tax=Curtobacterium sp. NPDC098951 TaxID=3363974 RepID=UPI00382FD242